MTNESALAGHGEGSESDIALLERIEQGEEGALAILFQRHSRLVYAVALRVLKDPSQAEDLMQEVFMHIWKKPLGLDPTRGKFGAFLSVMTRNRAVDVLRTRRQEQFPEAFDVVSSFDLAKDSERRLILERVREAAGFLPVEQRSMLDLAFFEGLTHSEIAAKTNVPLGTVKTRIRTALLTLERTLSA